VIQYFHTTSSDDGIIAYTWMEYIPDRRRNLPLRLPITKPPFARWIPSRPL
jgi:PhoPQ-activated pathogenicity-related protein